MKKKDIGTLVTGMVLGAALTGGAAAVSITAEPSTSPIFVDGRQVHMTAYRIDGSNYVRLRDIGRAVGFNVYWNNGVQVDTSSPYTGEPPMKSKAATVLTDDVDALRQEIIDRTNAVRQEYGLSVLPTDPLLMEAAQVRADEMAATGVYSHTRPDVRRYNTVTDCLYMAENIHSIGLWRLEAQQKELAQAAVDEWAASSGHLKNILKGQTASIGVGLARGVNADGFECWYCVQEFLYKGYSITWVGQCA